jgi:hypothetical protein
VHCTGELRLPGARGCPCLPLIMLLVALTPALESLLGDIEECLDDPPRRKLLLELHSYLERSYPADSCNGGEGGPSLRGVPPRLLAALTPYLQEAQRQQAPNEPPIDIAALLQGGRLIFPPKTPQEGDVSRRDSNSRRREDLLRRQEERDYRRMTANVSGVGASEDRASVRDIQSTIRFQAAVGFNMIIAIAGAFWTFWWFSKFFVQKESHRLAMGLAGAVFMMLLEMLIFVLRSLKADEAVARCHRRNGSGMQQQRYEMVRQVEEGAS